jgi:hypothetical protein
MKRPDGQIHARSFRDVEPPSVLVQDPVTTATLAFLAPLLWVGGALAIPTPTQRVPRPDHVVIVIEENHSYSEIIGSPAAPYINSLARQGASFTQSYAVAHPSEPNYLALFSGSTQGVDDDSCPHTYSAANLANELIAANLTFGGYSEDLPSAGYNGCTSAAYARKHNPWVDFSNVPVSDNLPLTSFPAEYSTLPTLAIVVPNLNNDMHNGTVQQGDSWLQQHTDAYLQWAIGHNSLVVVTWDEDDSSTDNHIPTIFVGAMVNPGQYAEVIDHYNILRTLEEMYTLPHAGNTAAALAITDVWAQTPASPQTDTPTPTNTPAVTASTGSHPTATVMPTSTWIASGIVANTPTPFFASTPFKTPALDSTQTATTTPTPTLPSRVCVGDCDANGTVTVDELIEGVDIALGYAPLHQCPAFDCDGDGSVTVECLIKGVNAALNGCAPLAADPGGNRRGISPQIGVER